MNPRRFNATVWSLAVVLAATILWQSPIAESVLAQVSGPSVTINRDRNWITDFGGKAADGADGEDDTAFNLLIQARIAAQQYDAFLPPGIWNISQTVALPRDFTLRGAGLKSVIKMADSMATPAIKMNKRTLCEGFYIEGNTAGATSGSIGISVDGGIGDNANFVGRAWIRDVRIFYCDDGLYLNSCGTQTFENLHIAGCDNGFRIGGVGGANATTFLGGEIESCKQAGLIETASSTIHLLGMTIENNELGVRVNAATGNFSMMDCYCEDNGEYDFRSDASIVSSRLIGNRHTNSDNALLIYSAQHLLIDSCRFHTNSTGRSIYLGSTAARWVTIGSGNAYQNAPAFDPTVDDLGRGTTYPHTPDVSEIFGDGTTDDTTNLQAWLLKNPNEAYLPAGTYIVSGKLTLADGQRLTGAGKTKTIIKAATGYAGIVLETGSDCTVRDLRVQGLLTASSVGIAPGTDKLRTLFERVDVTNFPVCYDLASSNSQTTIRDSRITGGTTAGVRISGTPESVLVDGCAIDQCGDGVLLSGVSLNTKVANCSITQCTAYGVNITANTQSASIVQNRFASNATADCRINANARATRFVGNQCNTSPISFTAASGTGSLIESNVMNPGGGGTPKSITLTNAAVTDAEIAQNVYLAGAHDPSTDDAGTRTRYRPFLSGTSTVDVDSIAAGGVYSTNVIVAGAVLGDSASAGASPALNSSLVVSARVSSAGTVTVTIHNPTGGAIDPPSTLFTAKIVR